VSGSVINQSAGSSNKALRVLKPASYIFKNKAIITTTVAEHKSANKTRNKPSISLLQDSSMYETKQVCPKDALDQLGTSSDLIAGVATKPIVYSAV